MQKSSTNLLYAAHSVIQHTMPQYAWCHVQICRTRLIFATIVPAVGGHRSAAFSDTGVAAAADAACKRAGEASPAKGTAGLERSAIIISVH